jgi:GT2 family glycosyltransferase
MRIPFFARWLTKFLKWWRYQGRYYGSGGIFIRKQVFLALGGFQPYDLLEDYDLARRMENYGPTLYLPETIIASPRKFQGKKLKAALTWLIIQSLFMLGIDPNRLARWYRL